MYQLTLTANERKAIDWIGNRYSHGNELYSILWGHCLQSPDDACWDFEGEITFTVPEVAAWTIADIAEESEYRWDCFSEELAAKMQAFVDSIA